MPGGPEGNDGAGEGKAAEPRRGATAHIPTMISVLAFGFSTVSYYESAMRQAELAVYVPPVIHYGRDGGGDVELFAIPITITNEGARNGTVLSMDLEVERLDAKEADAPRIKRYYSAYLGEHPRNSDAINKAFTPASINGRQTYSETIRFYPAGNPLPKLVQDSGQYRFTLRLNLATPSDPGFLDKIFLPRVGTVTFTLSMPFLSDQWLGFRRGSIAMHAKDYKPTTSGRQ
jgi:hypothetical protein